MSLDALRAKLQQNIQNDKGDKNTSNQASRSDINEAYSSIKNNSLFAGDGVGAYEDRMKCAIERLQDNDKWTVNTYNEETGEYEDQKLLDAIADSYDSELDLYINEIVRDVMYNIGENDQVNFGSCSKSYLSDAAIEYLASKGIRADAVGDTNRTYVFSLVKMPSKEQIEKMTTEEIMSHVYSDDAEILTDEKGNKGSIIFSDCLIPDGYAQGAEFNLSSILDEMGYDCVSKADFKGFTEAEYFEYINGMEDLIQSGEFDKYSNEGLDKLYGQIKDNGDFRSGAQNAVNQLWGGRGFAPGTGGGIDGTEAENYVDVERYEEERKERALEEEKEKERQEFIDNYIYDAKQDYIAKNGTEPTAADLEQIEKEATNKADIKFGLNWNK